MEKASTNYINNLWENWPLLQQALFQGTIEPIDLILAQTILGSNSADLYPAACTLCHLLLATREGHLCIQKFNNSIYPEPTELPSSLILQGFDQLLTLPSNPYIHFWGHSLYLQCYWHYENSCIKLFQQHESLTPTHHVDEAHFASLLAKNPNLLPEQSDAIWKILHHTITLITGGPGTGKTYTAGCLIKILWNSLQPIQKQNYQIALAAPTGKAASHLLQSISRFIGEDSLPLAATTLHTLLELSPYSKKTPKLTQDLILVDESSMVDIKLMETLLKALKPGARLILLGDHRQLPPVEPGAPFFDLINFRSQSSKPSQQPAFLKKCLRAELQEIIHFADAINQGDEISILKMLQSSNSPINGKILPPTEQYNSTIEQLAHKFPILTQPDSSALKSFRILTPLRRGLWGVEHINRHIHSHFLKRVPHGTTPLIPILLVANDHLLKLYNGEMGFLKGNQAYFPTTENAWRTVPAAILPRYQYGYCLSVHKSQGSEFDHITVLLPPGSETLGRAVLYTAVTRARHSVELWYEPSTLTQTIKKEYPRLSNFSEKMYQ